MTRLATFIVLMAAVMLGLSGCMTMSTGLADTAAPGEYKALGMTKGSSTGVYLFGFFSLTEDSDGQAAYKTAVNNVPGATGLIGASMQSTIVNLFIVQLDIVKVRGQAVK